MNNEITKEDLSDWTGYPVGSDRFNYVWDRRDRLSCGDDLDLLCAEAERKYYERPDQHFKDLEEYPVPVQPDDWPLPF